MMDKKKFNKIKKEYGPVASWAIWKEVGETPKSNMEDLNILDPQQNPDLLSELKPNVVFVGLNTSKDISGLEPFSNFHPTNPFANDYKTRYALKGTELWGGYMTDIIKKHEELHSLSVVKHLRKYPEVVDENIETFRKELKDLGTKNPKVRIGTKILEEVEEEISSPLRMEYLGPQGLLGQRKDSMQSPTKNNQSSPVSNPH